jgi:hypothetical protein
MRVRRRRCRPERHNGRRAGGLAGCARVAALMACVCWLAASSASAQAPAAAEGPSPGAASPGAAGASGPSGEVARAPANDVAAAGLDRVAVRFTAPETGGVERPQFIFERELAFEARLEALADGGFRPSALEPYLDRHVRSALERHMAEVLLFNLEVTPEPTARDLAVRQRSARLTLSQQVGGDAALESASAAEGISTGEVSRLLTRRARASLYLDRMVATMLTPSDTELRIVHRTTRTPFSGADYDTIAPMLQRWYVAQRLNAAVRAFYEGARSRILVTTLTRAEAPEPPSAPE